MDNNKRALFPEWLELLLYAGLLGYCSHLLLNINTVMPAISWLGHLQYHRYLFPLALGYFWGTVLSIICAVFYGIGSLVSLVCDPSGNSNGTVDRDFRSAIRWIALCASPVGGALVAALIYAAVCVGIPCGLIVWLWRQPRKISVYERT